MSTNTGYEPNPVDHRGNQQVGGLPLQFIPAQAGNAGGLPQEDHQMAPLPVTPQHSSPSKDSL